MLNQLIGMISSREREMRHLTGEIDAKLSAVHESVKETKENQAAADTLNEANALNARLREILYGFKIKDNE
jgi:hypothetical protein